MLLPEIAVFAGVTIAISNINYLDPLGVAQPSWERLYADGQKAAVKNDLSAAEASFKSALDAGAGDSQKDMMALDGLYEIYERERNYAALEQVMFSYIRVLKKSREYPPVLIGVAYLKLAEISSFANRLEDGVTYLNIALPILKKNCGADSPDVGIALNNLGEIEFQLKKPLQSETHFRKALSIFDRAYGSLSVIYGATAMNLAQLLEEIGRHKEAAYWYGRCSAALNASLGVDDPLSREVVQRCRTLKLMQVPARKRNVAPRRSPQPESRPFNFLPKPGLQLIG